MKKLIISTFVVLFALLALWLVKGGNSTPSIDALPQTVGINTLVGARIEPAHPVAGAPVTIILRFTHPDGSPVTDLAKHHERLLHVVLVGEDLASLGHIHPEDFPEINVGRSAGEYAVRYVFPSSGTFIASVDAMDMKEAISRQFLVHVGGSAPRMEKNVLPERLSGCFRGQGESVSARLLAEMTAECPDGYALTLSAPAGLTALEPARFAFHVEKDGKPLNDLSPYLGAAMHLAIIPDTLDTALHRHVTTETKSVMMDMGNGVMMSHGYMVSDTFGPNAESEPIIFPHAGSYRIFVQFKRGEEIIIAPLSVDIKD